MREDNSKEVRTTEGKKQLNTVSILRTLVNTIEKMFSVRMAEPFIWEDSQ